MVPADAVSLPRGDGNCDGRIAIDTSHIPVSVLLPLTPSYLWIGSVLGKRTSDSVELLKQPIGRGDPTIGNGLGQDA